MMKLLLVFVVLCGCALAQTEAFLGDTSVEPASFFIGFRSAEEPVGFQAGVREEDDVGYMTFHNLSDRSEEPMVEFFTTADESIARFNREVQVGFNDDDEGIPGGIRYNANADAVEFYFGGSFEWVSASAARAIDFRRGDWTRKQALNTPLKAADSDAGLCAFTQERTDALVNPAEGDYHYFSFRDQETGEVMISACQVDAITGLCNVNERSIATGFSGAARMQLVGSIVYVAIGADVGLNRRSGVMMSCSALSGSCSAGRVFASDISTFNVDFVERAGSNAVFDMLYVDTTNRLVLQPYDFNADTTGTAIVLAEASEMTLQRANTCCGEPRALFSVAQVGGQTVVAQVVNQEVDVPGSAGVTDELISVRVMNIQWSSTSVSATGTIVSSETVPDDALDYNEMGSIVSTRALAIDMAVVGDAPFIALSYSSNVAYSHVQDSQVEGFDQSATHESFTVRAFICNSATCENYESTQLADSLLLNAGGLFSSVLQFDFPYHVGVRTNPNTGLPHVSIATLNGNPILLDCLDNLCRDASVVVTDDHLGGHFGEVGVVFHTDSIMVVSRGNNGLGNNLPQAQRFLNSAASPTADEPIQCSTEHVAEMHNSDDRLYICTKLPVREAEDATQYYVWAPVGGKLRSYVHDNSDACVDCPWVGCTASSTTLNDYSSVVNRY